MKRHNRRGVPTCPSIHDPVTLAARVRAATASARIVLAEQERTTTLCRAVREAVDTTKVEMPDFEIAVGPEGGWAPDEEALFDANGWRAVSLGPRILRAETAAIAALAVVASAWSESAYVSWRPLHCDSKRICVEKLVRIFCVRRASQMRVAQKQTCQRRTT